MPTPYTPIMNMICLNKTALIHNSDSQQVKMLMLIPEQKQRAGVIIQNKAQSGELVKPRERRAEETDVECKGERVVTLFMLSTD